MNTPPFNILISGAGQIGSRYLQGLAKCRLPLKIYVQDVFEEFLGRAEQRWNEVLGVEVAHGVSFHSSLESLPRRVDVAIVATTADVRPQVVGEIANLAVVRFWVLEKVLAQNQAGLDDMILHVRNGSGAWVNMPRRMMFWHRQIKSQLGLHRPLSMEVKGGAWGLACNAVHFLDLLSWWTGESLKSVSTARLNPNWFESKRRGYWEVHGTLEAHFSEGSRALLSSRQEEVPVSITASDSHQSWLINEAGGLATRSDGTEIRGRLSYQSELSAPLVETIHASADCDLPTLQESAAIHRIFIGSLQEHWMRAGHPTVIGVPIT